MVKAITKGNNMIPWSLIKSYINLKNINWVNKFTFAISEYIAQNYNNCHLKLVSDTAETAKAYGYIVKILLSRRKSLCT